MCLLWFDKSYLLIMTLYEYNDLDECEQHEAIWDYGVHIGERIEGKYRIMLYQMFSFYVELRYHMEHNVLKGARSFSSIEQLKPYTDNIDIKQLLGWLITSSGQSSI